MTLTQIEEVKTLLTLRYEVLAAALGFFAGRSPLELDRTPRRPRRRAVGR
jgi:hypothetical protein